MDAREGRTGQDRIVGLGGLWLVSARAGATAQRPRVEFVPAGTTRSVGSGKTADIVVADRFMSRMHFSIRWLGDNPTIEDLTSTNGTTINGVPVAGRLRMSLPSLVRAGMSEFGLFEAAATERGRAVVCGRLLGLGEDSALLFHELFSASMRQGPMARLAAWYVGMMMDRGGQAGAAGESP